MAETRTRVCPQCEKSFTYAVGKGKDRKVCSERCRNRRKRASQKRHKAKILVLNAVCRVEGCAHMVTRLRTGLCEGCYCRIRRNGDSTYRRVKAKPITMSSGGYVQFHVPDHPLSRNGSVGEHRIVLYRAIGAGPHHCYWCDAAVRWDTETRGERLVVDHLNDVKTDNNLANLVPSCNQCNAIRGTLGYFLDRMLPAPFERFISLVRQRKAQGRRASA